MQGRVAVIGVVVASVVFAAGVVGGCAGPVGENPRQPVPTFAPAQARDAAGSADHRATLLPTDCQDVMSGPGMSALLGKPMDSVQSHTVVGVGSASVGRLERVSCLYRLSGVKTGAPSLELNLAAYDSAPAADHQLTTNAAAERGSAQATEDFTIGTARAALMTERGQRVLLVASGQTSLTMTLRGGVVPDDQSRPIMVDLAQRVLPRLAPVRPGPSG